MCLALTSGTPGPTGTFQDGNYLQLVFAHSNHGDECLLNRTTVAGLLLLQRSFPNTFQNMKSQNCDLICLKIVTLTY